VHGRHDSEKASGRDARSDRRLSGKYALRCANVFHAGDGNLHPLIMYDANQPGQLERATAFGAEILELSVRFGGTITGEHGVGIEKIMLMAEQFTEWPRSAPFIASRRPSTSMGCSIPARACRRLPVAANIPRRAPARAPTAPRL
jgi:glycolate oxidase